MALAQRVEHELAIDPTPRGVVRRLLARQVAREVVVAEGPGWHAFQLLHWAFVVLPIVAGASKFSDALGTWQTSVAPLLSDLFGISLRSVGYTVGAAEAVVGVIVAFNPRIGGWLVAAWLWGIVITQLLGPGYVDVAFRDAALSLGALALARLGAQYEHAVEPSVVRAVR